MQNTIGAVLLGIVLAQPARPTTLIVQLRNDRAVKKRILIVADSLGTFPNTSPPRLEFRCKIAVENRVVFAFAGPVSSPSHGFDAYREMQAALSVAGSFAGKMAVFQTRILQALNRLGPTGTSLEVVAVDVAHFPRYYLGVFATSLDKVWSLQPESGIREILPYDVKYVVLGLRDHIADALTHTPRKFDDDPDGVLQLLHLEMEHHPDAVGGDESVLEIHNGRIVWRTRGRCSPSNATTSSPDPPTTFR